MLSIQGLQRAAAGAHRTLCRDMGGWCACALSDSESDWSTVNIVQNGADRRAVAHGRTDATGH